LHEGRLAAVHGFHGLPEPIVGHCLLNHLIGAGEKDFIDIIGHSAEPDTPPPRMAITSIWWHGVEHRERLAYRRRRLTSRSTSAGRKLVEVKERRRPTGGSSSGSNRRVPVERKVGSAICGGRRQVQIGQLVGRFAGSVRRARQVHAGEQRLQTAAAGRAQHPMASTVSARGARGCRGTGGRPVGAATCPAAARGYARPGAA
jgi:hypothetical protein